MLCHAKTSAYINWRMKNMIKMELYLNTIHTQRERENDQVDIVAQCKLQSVTRCLLISVLCELLINLNMKIGTYFIFMNTHTFFPVETFNFKSFMLNSLHNNTYK